MAQYDEDYRKLLAVQATNTPRQYLVLTATSAAASAEAGPESNQPASDSSFEWVSLAVIAASASLAEFIAYIEQINSPLRSRVIIVIFLWLLSRVSVDELALDPAITTELQSAIQANQLTLEVTSLLAQYQQWYNNVYALSLQADLRRLAVLQSDQVILANSPELFYTKPVLERVVVATTPTVVVNDQIVTNLTGLDLLNLSTVSAQVPIIVNSDPDGNITVKVYDPPNGQDSPDYKDILPGLSQLGTRNSLYFFTDSAPRVITVTFSPTAPPELTFAVVEATQEVETAQRLIETHSSLRLGQLHTKEILSTIRLFGSAQSGYGYPVITTNLLASLLTDGRLNRYLFTDETREPFLERNRLTVTYRRPFSAQPLPAIKLNISLVPQVSLAQQPLEIIGSIQGEQGPTYQISQDGIPYLSLSIRSPTEYFLVSFLPHLIQLFSYWYQRQLEIANFTLYWLGPRSQDVRGQTSRAPSQAGGRNSARASAASNPEEFEGRRQIFVLRALAPEVFTTSYAKKCIGSIKQPVIIQPEAVAEWNNRTFQFGGQYYHRLALPYPNLNQPKYYFGCANDVNPFIGLKDNNSYNAAEFPFIPCCYPKDQNVPGNNIWNYLRNMAMTREVSRTEHLIRTSVLLDLGRVGAAPPAIAQLLAGVVWSARSSLANQSNQAEVVEAIEPTRFTRFGTVKGPNSFLHALCIAMNEPGYAQIYLSALDLVAKTTALENYLVGVRRNLASRVLATVLKQELYDLTDPEIMAELTNPLVYFDPSRVFRALEVYFGVRIFLFEWPHTNQEGFQMPRSRWFTVYNQPLDKPVVLVLTHRGSTVDIATIFAQTELIVLNQAGRDRRGYGVNANNVNAMLGNNQAVFEPAVAPILQRALEACQTVSLSRFDKPTSNSAGALIQTIGFTFDPERVFTTDLGQQVSGLTLVGQELNSAGKGIGITLALVNQPHQQIKLRTPAFAPLNLPRAKVTANTLAQADILIRSLPAPSAISVDDHGQLTGYWYEVASLANQLYLPLVATAVPATMANLPRLPAAITASPNNAIEAEMVALRQSQRAVYLLIQISLYLYLLYGLDQPDENPRSITDPSLLPDFWRDYVVIGGLAADSSHPDGYDWTTVARTLPEGNLAEVLASYAQTSPTLITTTGTRPKLRLANDQLNQRLYATIAQWLHERRGDEIEIPTVLERYYINEQDFLTKPHQRIFLDWNSYQGWLRYQHTPQMIIKTELSQDQATDDAPYLYWSLSSPSYNPEIYLVQNVAEGDYRRAITVAVQWRRSKVNLGFQAPVYTEPLPAFKLYAPDSNNQLELQQDYSNGGEAIRLLSYRSGYHAALLNLF